MHPTRSLRVGLFHQEYPMRTVSFACVAALALAATTAHGDELKSGPEKKIGGSFTVKAITGANKGKELCYV